MSVRAKMRCTERKEVCWSQAEKLAENESNVSAVHVKLQPVYSNDPASPNFSWSQASPSGELNLMITNPAAHEQFKVGGTYFVDFTPAD